MKACERIFGILIKQIQLLKSIVLVELKVGLERQKNNYKRFLVKWVKLVVSVIPLTEDQLERQAKVDLINIAPF